MKTVFDGFLVASLLVLTLNVAALAQGGSSLGGGAIGTSEPGNTPDSKAAEDAKEQIDKARPDGSTETSPGTIVYPDGSSMKDAMQTGDWDVSIPNCANVANVTVKPAIRECRVDLKDHKAYAFEIVYVEAVCPDFTPRYRRLSVSFKRIGPCKQAEYEEARHKAEETYGETWPETTDVVFEPNPPGGGGTQLTDGGDDTGGLTANMVMLEEKYIVVIWKKDDTWFEATYYPDGTSAWSGKKDQTDYPLEKPPHLPKSVAGHEIKFKTAAKTPEPAKTDETKTPSTPGGSGKSVQQNNKKGKKGTAPAASIARSDPGSQPDVSGLIGTGVAIGVGIGASRRGGGMSPDHRMGEPSAATSRQIKSGGPGAVRSTKSTAVARPGVSQTINTRVGTPTISGGGFRVGF